MRLSNMKNNDETLRVIKYPIEEGIKEGIKEEMEIVSEAFSERNKLIQSKIMSGKIQQANGHLNQLPENTVKNYKEKNAIK
jgi:hypothetical protein